MANSYNELLGLGAHSPDANLVVYYDLQETSGTTITDYSGNGNHGTFSGGITTTTGPSWLSSAIDFDGSADYISSVSSAFSNLAVFTIAAWVKSDQTATDVRAWGFVEGASTGDVACESYINYTGGDIILGYVRASGTTDDVIGYTTSATTLSNGSWHYLLHEYNPAANTLAIVFDDSAAAITYTEQTAALNTATNTQPIYLGARNNAGTTDKYFDGKMAGWVFFNRSLATGERSQLYNGPEPIYTSGVSFSADGTYSVGTWDSQSNGTATYEVVAANAAGSVIDSATTSSGDLDISAENGNTVYLLVRATNSGGYDIGDKATRTSAYGSSNDGYYELASVTASDGAGGGPSHASTMLLAGVGI